MFFRRKDYPAQIKAVNAALKPWFHLRSARSFAQLKARLGLYFTAGCTPLPLAGDEGQRLMLATAAAMNYGFAFRTATYAALRKIAAELLRRRHRAGWSWTRPTTASTRSPSGSGPASSTGTTPAAPSPASMMAPGTTFAETGQAVLLPGTHRTSSYLAVAGDQAANSLYSACHGAGTVISDLVARGVSGNDPLKRVTRRYRYDDGAPTDAHHFDDRGVNAAVDVLVRNGLVKPVARMRPVAVLH